MNISAMKLTPFSFGISGEPQQRLAFASNDGKIQHGVWECGPGMFDLNFSWDETAFVLDGRAELENLDTGEKVTLLSGSMIAFRSGSRWRWNVPWKIKKVFTVVA